MNRINLPVLNRQWLSLTIGTLLCALLIAPASADNDSTGDKNRPEWYLKTSVEVVDPDSGQLIRDTRSGVMGRLAESEEGFDRHDVPAYASTVNSRAAIVFIHGEDWQELAGEYLSNYHNNKGSRDSWVFTVHSNLAPDVVTLQWDGLFELSRYEENGVLRYDSVRTANRSILKRLSLIDLETGELIKAVARKRGKKTELNTYTFSMNGKTSRDFRWVLGKVKYSHFEPVSSPELVSKSATKNQNVHLSSLQIRQQNAAVDISNHSKFGTPPE